MELSPIIFYYYFDLADTDAFCDLLRRRFVESGHDRPIEFRSWDCYDAPPARDGDVYCYDALVLSTMADEGYIRVLPDIIDTSRVFPWILDRSRIRYTDYLHQQEELLRTLEESLGFDCEELRPPRVPDAALKC